MKFEVIRKGDKILYLSDLTGHNVIVEVFKIDKINKEIDVKIDGGDMITLSQEWIKKYSRNLLFINETNAK